jgi:hypothetical protein
MNRFAKIDERLAQDPEFAVADVTGWQAYNLVGQPIHEFIHPDDLAQLRKVVADDRRTSSR